MNGKGIDSEKLAKMPKPKLEIGFTIFFNEDCKKEEFEKILNLKCKSFKLKKETKINPITLQKAPGYILFELTQKEEVDCGELIDSMVNYVYQYKDELLNLLKKYEGKIKFYLDILINSLKMPFFKLNSETIIKMADLNASLDTSMELNY